MLDGHAARRDRARRVNEQKSDLEARLNSLEQQLDRAARDASATETAASRKMAEAAGSIRDNRLGDKLRYSQNLVNRGSPAQSVNAAENEIAGGIEELRERLSEAASAVGQGGENANRMENALACRRPRDCMTDTALAAFVVKAYQEARDLLVEARDYVAGRLSESAEQALAPADRL